MSNESIKGIFPPTAPRSSKGKYSFFDTITIDIAGGGQRVLTKISAAGDVASALRLGGSGELYVSTYGGQSGIHGVRLDDGTQAYCHYNNMEMIVLIGAVAGMLVLALGLTGLIDFMITPVLIGVALIAMYFFLRSNRLSAQKQFEDGG